MYVWLGWTFPPRSHLQEPRLGNTRLNLGWDSPSFRNVGSSLTSAHNAILRPMAQGSHLGFWFLPPALPAENKAAQEGEMTSDFKILLATREPLMKYKDGQLGALGEKPRE